MVLCWSCSAPKACFHTLHVRGVFCDAGCAGRYAMDRMSPTQSSVVIHRMNLERWKRGEPHVCVRPHPSHLTRFGGDMDEATYRSLARPTLDGLRPWLHDAETLLQPLHKAKQCPKVSETKPADQGLFDAYCKSK